VRFVFGTRFYSIRGVSGMCFYPLEMMQALYDTLHIPTEEYIIPQEKNIRQLYFNNKYTFLFPEMTSIEKNDIFFTTVNLFTYLLENNPSVLINAKVIYIINAFKTFEVLKKWFKKNQHALLLLSKLFSKIFLLSEEGFENSLLNVRWFHNEVINIKRGIYTNYWKQHANTRVDSYYVYRRYDIGEMEHSETWPKAKQWLVDNHKRYLTGRFSTPEHVCSGFVYLRYVDYMPRLPFEFWFYDKPVILFDISDGLKKKVTTQDLPLRQPFVLNKSHFPKWNLDALIKHMGHMGVL